MSSTTPIYDLSLVVLALTKPSYFQHTETCSLWWKDESPVYFLFAYLRQPCIITNRSVWLKPERNMTHHELLRVSHPVNEDLHRDVWVHNFLDPSSGIYAHQILRPCPTASSHRRRLNARIIPFATAFFFRIRCRQTSLLISLVAYTPPRCMG